MPTIYVSLTRAAAMLDGHLGWAERVDQATNAFMTRLHQAPAHVRDRHIAESTDHTDYALRHHACEAHEAQLQRLPMFF